MNNKGQNVNPNGTPQNHRPNQGYPQQNNQYQGNGYNGQNPQNFNRNVNNQNPYQNQIPQANNVNNPQFQGYSNGQNQPQNNMNNLQYRGQGYNAQSPQNNNMNNPQYKGQGYNGQNQPYNNMNNPQYRGQGNNGQNPQFGNNQNSNPMNRRPKMDSKMVGYITAAVAAILVVLMIFMFSSSSGKPGGATPEEAVKNVISAEMDGDYKKAINNTYFKSDEARTKALEYYNTLDGYRKELAKTYSGIEIGKVTINENRAKVEYKKGRTPNPDIMYASGNPDVMYAKKVNGRWFAENMFSYLD